MLLSCDSVDRLVEHLTSQHPALQLLPQQAALSLGSFHEATVLLSAARQIRNDLVDRSIWNILIDGETSLTFFKHRERRHVYSKRLKFTLSTIYDFQQQQDLNMDDA